MTIVESRISVWEALAGRAPGQPLGPADPGLWTAVAERVNPAKARPMRRPGIEESKLVSVRGVPYTMLRSPDEKQACYLRLSPEEVELTHLMDGSRCTAIAVADFDGTATAQLGARFESADFLHLPHVPLDLHPLHRQRRQMLVGAPRKEQAQVGLGVDAGGAGVAAQIGRRRQPQDEIMVIWPEGQRRRCCSHTNTVTSC